MKNYNNYDILTQKHINLMTSSSEIGIKVQIRAFIYACLKLNEKDKNLTLHKADKLSFIYIYIYMVTILQ